MCYFYHVFHRVGTAQFHWIQQKHIVIFDQEPAGGICQLGGPRVQLTQIQFIEKFTMSLPNSQSGGMGILGLITPPATGLPWVVWAPVVPQLPWPLGFSSGGSVSKLCCSLPPQLPLYFLASTLCTYFVQ